MFEEAGLTGEESPGAGGVELNLDLLDDNDRTARRNREQMETAGLRCINIMSSPGSGKTTLLERTLGTIEGWPVMAVMEGDMTTELDADRLRACGAEVVAITTGRSCHLESNLVENGLQELERNGRLDRFDLIVIENVGNLICPAAYDLGEHVRVVLVATTEGEDKPLKYPYMFEGADCVLITKLDISPYLKLDVEKLILNIRQINPAATIMALSAETGEGMPSWLEWLKSQAASVARRCLPSRAKE